MLDPINEKEFERLKCEKCGLYFYNSEEENEDYISIDETGQCRDCNNELRVNY